MNKGDLVDAVASRLGDTKAAAARMVDAVIESIGTGIRHDDSVTITGFGTFTRKQRKGRTGRNPVTGQPMEIKPSVTVAFRASPSLKDSMCEVEAGSAR